MAPESKVRPLNQSANQLLERKLDRFAFTRRKRFIEISHFEKTMATYNKLSEIKSTYPGQRQRLFT